MSRTALHTNLASLAPPKRVARAAPDASAVLDAALERLAAARAPNRSSRSGKVRAMALCVSALGVLGAQVLLIAIVHLLGISGGGSSG
jgi:hypothetical protein